MYFLKYVFWIIFYRQKATDCSFKGWSWTKRKKKPVSVSWSHTEQWCSMESHTSHCSAYICNYRLQVTSQDCL